MDLNFRLFDLYNLTSLIYFVSTSRDPAVSNWSTVRWQKFDKKDRQSRKWKTFRISISPMLSKFAKNLLVTSRFFLQTIFLYCNCSLKLGLFPYKMHFYIREKRSSLQAQLLIRIECWIYIQMAFSPADKLNHLLTALKQIVHLVSRKLLRFYKQICIG
jgi:hypothetical protein